MYVRFCSKQVACLNSDVLHQPSEVGIIVITRYGEENWDTERYRDLLKVTDKKWWSQLPRLAG